jgi:hypothetical protein
MTKGNSGWCRILGPVCAGLLMALGLAAAAQAAEPARCSAQDIKGEGACTLVLGYAWNGRQCGTVSGCSCVGKDCPGIFHDEKSCQAAYAHCSCKPQQARGVGACARFLGYAWNGKTCTGLSGCSCKGADCKSLFDTEDKCTEAYAHCR